jgi:hypothetical protein
MLRVGVVQIAILSEMSVMFYPTLIPLVEDDWSVKMEANFHPKLKIRMHGALLKHPFTS